jgi:hypothetical protein
MMWRLLYLEESHLVLLSSLKEGLYLGCMNGDGVYLGVVLAG